MLAWLVRLVVLGAVAALAFLGPIATQERDDASINTYDSTMQLSADGQLTVDERISVRMPSGKHGIYRIFDTADPRRTGVEHPIDLESVERDGRPEEWTWEYSKRGTELLRIGAESVILDAGDHDYRILHRTVDVLEPGEDDGETVWWWDVVGSGWQMPIGATRVDVELPVEPLRAECVMGDDEPCTATVEGTSLVVATGALDPFTPVTVRVAFPADALPAPPAGRSPWVTIALSVLVAAGAAAVALRLVAGTREREPGFPVLFEPPPGIGPALGVKVLDERPSSDDVQATLYALAERGVLRLDGDDDEWTVTLLAAPSSTDDQIGSLMLGALGLTAPGQRFVVSKDADSGERLSKARTALRAEVDTAARSYLHPSGVGYVVMALGWLSLIGLLFFAGSWLFNGPAGRPWPLIAGLAVFALVAMGAMFDVGVLTKRTDAGRELWSRTGGFARFLTTDSSESRFDAAKHLDWYPRYLPWALALGAADAWARRFESQGVATPPVPYVGWTGHGLYSASRMTTSFNAAMTSAAAAYSASQASSGGGGFSGGSGGGGGGGGSW